VNNKKYIYLDSAATSSLDHRVLAAMMPFLSGGYGNPGSIHRIGREAKAAMETAREYIAALIEANPSEIVLTSGGTEANNFAAFIACQNSEQDRRHIISSKAEHEAVLNPLRWYASQGYKLDLLNVLKDGSVDVDWLRDAIRDETIFVSLMHANNETGALNPVSQIADICREHRIPYHCDAAQSIAKTSFSVKELSIDFASLSAHKIHGPKGVGALFVRAGTETTSLIKGGSQERGRRGGTENIAAIVGFGEAARIALSEKEQRIETWNKINTLFRESVQEKLPAAIINSGADALANILSVSFPYASFGIDGETLLMNMDLEGIAVSSGSACTAGSIEASHVMLAIGHDRETSKATLRFSFGKDTDENEIRQTLQILSDVINRMK
jgi:cysteine desulfurase